jgi:D-serine deaminase-like pyridoxal phosphate-dependent protein
MNPRYRLNDPSALLSPSLLIFRPLVRHNLEAMVGMARGAERVRAHVKTHKMPALVQLTESYGIHKHKAATIAEAEMIAANGGTDVLLAYPLVGPNLGRFTQLVQKYPATAFRAVVDHPQGACALSEASTGLDRPVSVLVDLDVGMGRTGIEPGPAAEKLYALTASLPHLQVDGLHAYDGHLKITELDARRAAVREVWRQVFTLRDQIFQRNLAVPRIVLGGTPTFPLHTMLNDPGVECSPGTTTLYDAGYAAALPDLPFQPAAVLLTRVVSRPRPGRLCLDLGHKAVAADPPGARLTLLGVPEAKLGGQSEEHLVVDTPEADAFPPGTPLLAIPTHICPTCALHRWAYVIEDGAVVDKWEVAARDRVIGI